MHTPLDPVKRAGAKRATDRVDDFSLADLHTTAHHYAVKRIFADQPLSLFKRLFRELDEAAPIRMKVCLLFRSRFFCDGFIISQFFPDFKPLTRVVRKIRPRRYIRGKKGNTPSDNLVPRAPAPIGAQTTPRRLPVEYSFNLFNKLAADGTTMAVSKFLRGEGDKGDKKEGRKTARTRAATPFAAEPSGLPVIVCVGSDLAIGDSLGPIVGSMLRYKTQGLDCFIYGTLKAPVTAKEIRYLRSFLKETHRGRKIIAVDAAVGSEGDIGLIKILDSPLRPGAGANKKLGCIGDISILGIVAEKSLMNYGLLNTTRLNLVYSMAEIVSDGLSSLLWQAHGADRRVV